MTKGYDKNQEAKILARKILQCWPKCQIAKRTILDIQEGLNAGEKKLGILQDIWDNRLTKVEKNRAGYHD